MANIRFTKTAEELFIFLFLFHAILEGFFCQKNSFYHLSSVFFFFFFFVFLSFFIVSCSVAWLVEMLCQLQIRGILFSKTIDLLLP